ncbi:hypothetical protein NP233_g1250 [Leucocoprinus birnbaumii]|uniref:Transmembrane protein n=1 Tax=Leucocoprinus birnbaumii TaxID=56174 RepID=A0AAD5YV08_9AGAR|nr:hypothetical protein NP233_g1250 [Leucocoprinus birnbaumii]
MTSVIGAAPQPPWWHGSPNSAIILTPIPTAPLVEVITRVFTSTFIITGLSVETQIISPLPNRSVSTARSFSQPKGTSTLSPSVPGRTSSSSTNSITSSSLSILSSIRIPPQTAAVTIILSHSSATTIPSGIVPNNPYQGIGSSASTSHESSDKSYKLARILPAIFIPLACVIALIYLALRRYRRKFAQTQLAPLPFDIQTPLNSEIALRTSRKASKGVQGSRGQTTPADRHGPTMDRLEDQAEIPPPMSHLGPPEAAASNDLEAPLVPAMQAQILHIQARLAEIEERHPDAPPPLYSMHVEGL